MQNEISLFERKRKLAFPAYNFEKGVHGTPYPD